jgi:hypothetical protein
VPAEGSGGTLLGPRDTPRNYCRQLGSGQTSRLVSTIANGVRGNPTVCGVVQFDLPLQGWAPGWFDCASSCDGGAVGGVKCGFLPSTVACNQITLVRSWAN